MNRSILLVGICLLGGGLAASAQEATPLRRGEYLSEEYIQVLTKTHSPFTAIRSSSYCQRILVSNDIPGETVLTLYGGFGHTVDDFVVLGVNGQIVKGKLAGFQIKTDRSFVAKFGKALSYQRVKSLEKFINTNTVAGVYRDSRGYPYTFTNDGKAIFPDRSFNYKVATDFETEIFRDYIYEKLKPGDKEAKELFFWVKRGSQLQLYKDDIKAVGSPVPEREPFLILQEYH